MNYNEPVASIIRPDSLDEFVGQKHLVGTGKPIRIAISKKHLFSMIFWGPPGVGKTTLAKIYAKNLNVCFHELTAVSAGKNDVKRIIVEAQSCSQPTILFLDEIHRFNKAQQDFLLPHVESGLLTLIGATTENPSFEVISPLLSRCKVFVLNSFTDSEMGEIIDRATDYMGKTGKYGKITLGNSERSWIINMANGDARQAISLIEATINLYGKITVRLLSDTMQSKYIKYDKKGEEHYNVISAFIKSMRAGDENASIYYLSRMVESGEDPKFIARRMVVFASEDIGLAQPTALVVANAVFKSCEILGYPECAISLAHGAIYLANCKKNRKAYEALRKAQDDVKKYGNLPIPLNLRNAPTKLMKTLGYGKGYAKYTDKSLLPEKIAKNVYVER